MRKAASLGGIRGSRKKQQPPAPPEPKENRPHVVSNNIPMEPSYPPAMEMQQHRKKPTSEETALTSKNYRLAKELVRVQK